MRARRAVLPVITSFALLLLGCSDDGGSAEPTTTTLEGCVQTVRGCIDPDTIEPGECVPSTPESEDCVNYRPLPDEADPTTSTTR